MRLILFCQALYLLLLQSAKIALAAEASPGLMDPSTQPVFQVVVPNPLDPSFIYNTSSGEIDVSVGEGVAETGLVASDSSPILTRVWGYGTPELGYTWPGRTFVQESYQTLNVTWHNKIEVSAGYLLSGKNNSHLGSLKFDFSQTSVVDDSFHWAYSLPGYEGFTIEEHGTPIVPHLHGGHTDAPFDGNPEYFFGPEVESGQQIQGPRYMGNKYVYENSQPAATLW
jgi:spore coat protein A